VCSLIAAPIAKVWYPAHSSGHFPEGPIADSRTAQWRWAAMAKYSTIKPGKAVRRYRRVAT